MEEIFRFALLGLGIGALYAISAQGIVLVFRASGVVNFAQGAFVVIGGYAYYEFRTIHGWPVMAGLVGVVPIAGLTGLLMYALLMRPMRSSSSLARTVATLGVLALVQSIAILRYGQTLVSVDPILPTSTVTILGAVIGVDRVILFVIGLVTTVVLWVTYRFTRFGQVTAAVSESELAASAMGHSPDVNAAINWTIGASLAGVTGALLAQIVFLEPNLVASLVLPALAAALLAGFSSFPVAFVAALGIGAAQSVMTYEVATRNWWSGWPQALPFVLVIIYLVARGRAIPLRSYIFDRLPAVGTGRIRRAPTAIATTGTLLLIVVLDDAWVAALTVSVCYAIVGLSVLLVTGYAGQLSLAQYVVGAMGAFVAAKLMDSWDVPFTLAFVIGIAAAMLVGVVLGAPALRTRGVYLAVATLGIAISLYALFLNNSKLVGSVDGVPVKTPSIFGIDIDPADHPRRYGAAAIVALLLLTLAVANLRRGTAGRRLLAVRSNERASLALGVSVFGAKLYAFMFSAGIAAVGVSLLAFLNTRVVFGRFNVFTSIAFVSSTVVGGLGMLLGPIIGANFFDGSIVSRLLSQNGTLDRYLPLAGAIAVLLVLRSGAEGIFERQRQIYFALVRRIGNQPSAGGPAPSARPSARRSDGRPGGIASVRTRPARVAPRRLEVRDLCVRFGGVTAIDGLWLAIEPGTVHGLIGPNGAGKTTAIDAITGFVPLSAGTIALDGQPLHTLGARRRALRGVGRSFQTPELFADLTVRENIAVGCDRSQWRSYFTDLVRPGTIHLNDAALAAVREFDLTDVFDVKPDHLPYGQRRLVAIARAMAAHPSILLLDEPAAGLDDQETTELAHLIRQLADDWGVGVLLVEHNLQMVLDVSDEVTVIAAGRELLAASPPDVVRTHPDVIEAYVGTASSHHSGEEERHVAIETRL